MQDQFTEHHWDNGMLNGIYQEFTPFCGTNGNQFGDCVEECTYKNGVKHGTWVQYSRTTKYVKKSCFYEDGRYHGTCKQYYPDGSLKTISNYTHGVLDGLYTEYFNGKLDMWKKIECTYVSGKPSGEYKRWDDTISEGGKLYTMPYTKKPALVTRCIYKEGSVIKELLLEEQLATYEHIWWKRKHTIV